MLKQKYFLTGIFILSAERQPIKLAWRKIVWLQKKKTFPETKAWQIFDGKVRNLKLHLQLLDASLKISQTICGNNKNKSYTIGKALNTDENKHPQLNVPCENIDISRTFTSSRIKLNEQAIIDLYRYFANYVTNIIEEFVRTDPMPLLNSIAGNKDNTLPFDDILKAGSFDVVIKEMSKKIYRRLENERSTPTLLNKIISYTKIDIDEDLKNKALIYLQIRHSIIHDESKADNVFKEMNNGLVTIKKGDKIALNYDLTNNAITTIFNFCKSIDNKLIEKDMVCKRFIEYPEVAPTPI
mgnify:CR=1 FL=1|jgi:hypothetical protein